MNRRAFVAGMVGGVLVPPLAVEAQRTEKMHRIGWLSSGSADQGMSSLGALRAAPGGRVRGGPQHCAGAGIPEMYGRAAVDVDRILKGAKPSDIPVEPRSSSWSSISRRPGRSG